MDIKTDIYIYTHTHTRISVYIYICTYSCFWAMYP